MIGVPGRDAQCALLAAAPGTQPETTRWGDSHRVGRHVGVRRRGRLDGLLHEHSQVTRGDGIIGTRKAHSLARAWQQARREPTPATRPFLGGSLGRGEDC